MLKRFSVVLVILMIAASMGTVFAAPTMSDSKKTMNDLIKQEQMLTNEKDAIMALKDQMILMMYIRAVDQMIMGMTPDKLKTTAQSFLKNQGMQEPLWWGRWIRRMGRNSLNPFCFDDLGAVETQNFSKLPVIFLSTVVVGASAASVAIIIEHG
jgi:hypothetical protein